MPLVIAESACVDPRAEIAADVEVGPFCVVGPGVSIGPGTRLVSHVCLAGDVTIGAGCTFRPFSVVGAETEGQEGSAIAQVGDGAWIGEGAIVRPGCAGGPPTIVGPRVRLGPHSRVSPGVEIGEGARIDAGVSLGDRVVVQPHAMLLGGLKVHPRVTIGRHAFVGGPTRLFHDVPPYMLADGHPAKVRCIHIVGLRRLGLDHRSIQALHEAHRLLYRAKVGPEDVARSLASHGLETPETTALVEFIRAQRGGQHGRALDRDQSSAETVSPNEEEANG